MRTNNSKVKNIIISVYFTLIVLAILLVFIFSMFNDLTSNFYLTLFFLALSFIALFFAVHSISKYFEYDSDGYKVEIVNKGLLISDYYNYREHIVAFHKSKLKGFKFKNYFVYIELVLLIENSYGQIKKERFNVTLVSRRKQKYIKKSLSNMIKYYGKPKD